MSGNNGNGLVISEAVLIAFIAGQNARSDRALSFLESTVGKLGQLAQMALALETSRAEARVLEARVFEAKAEAKKAKAEADLRERCGDVSANGRHAQKYDEI